jgi:hypothetical protein
LGGSGNFYENPVFAQTIMRTSHKGGLLALCGLASVLFVGCTSVSLPKAKGYTVMVGNTQYYAKSVKIHGSWVEMETDNGPVWANGVVIIPSK